MAVTLQTHKRVPLVRWRVRRSVDFEKLCQDRINVQLQLLDP
jgi:hypothetical protein